MKFKFLLFIFSIVALASCSTAYKSGQTPDDVYYSPARALDGSSYTKDEPQTRDYEEREIRMSTYDYRWRTLGEQYNYDYAYSPYRYGYDYGYYYNPYYYPCPVYISGVAITNPKNSTPRTANLRAYGNNPILLTNQKTFGTYHVNSRKAYTNSNVNSSTSSFIRKVITSARSTNNANYDERSRTNDNNRSYTPSSSNNSSSSGSSNSGSISRPARGHN